MTASFDVRLPHVGRCAPDSKRLDRDQQECLSGAINRDGPAHDTITRSAQLVEKRDSGISYLGWQAVAILETHVHETWWQFPRRGQHSAVGSDHDLQLCPISQPNCRTTQLTNGPTECMERQSKRQRRPSAGFRGALGKVRLRVACAPRGMKHSASGPSSNRWCAMSSGAGYRCSDGLEVKTDNIGAI